MNTSPERDLLLSYALSLFQTLSETDQEEIIAEMKAMLKEGGTEE